MTASAPARRSDAFSLDRLLTLRIPVSVEVALYVLIFAAAIAFRFWDLGARALHHDESIHAQWSWDLTRGNYTHSPVFHGPLYYHAQALVFLIFGASDYTSRVSAAIFGVVLVALPLLLRRRLGPIGTFAAVAFIALSPTIVYYSRFIREDIYMAVFVMGMAVSLWRYVDGGRDRWLVAFAVCLAGSFATKEATYLMVALFLLFLNAMIAADLAVATLRDRGLENDRRRRYVLGTALFPYAWAIVALWPFIGRIRKSAAWHELPRAGDVLIILGTLTVPLLMPALKSGFEALGAVDKGQLDWPGVCDATGDQGTRNRFALGGVYLMVIAAVAFVGLQWRPRTWAVSFLAATGLYLTLMTTLWTNVDGLCSGPWGSLDYWLSQQEEYRANQPWFYYFMLMPMYEFMPLVIATAGIWWATARGNAFSRFLVFWIAGTWIALSWAGEKMPWLNTHIAVPTALLAAWTIQRAWDRWRPAPRVDRPFVAAVAAIALIAAGAMLLAVFLPGGTASVAIRWLLLAGGAAAIFAIARPLGRSAIPAVLTVVAVGGLSIFSVRTMVMAVYERGDVPKDLLIYTQSAPDIPQIATDIDRLAEATGEGQGLSILVDSRDSFSWPWAWYLRDYNGLSYQDLSNGIPDNLESYDVLLVNESNIGDVNDRLASLPAQPYGSPRKYPHRWWFDERYKQAMAIEPGTSCLASAGDCGPWQATINIGRGTHLGLPNLDMYQRLFEGITEEGWLATWFDYWRNHDPGDPPGSINGYAYFPAHFDVESGKIVVEPLEPSVPTEDSEGRKVFGGAGFAPGQFFAPIDIAAGADGSLYVIDRATRKLQKFDAAGNFLAAVDVRGDDTATAAEPWGLAVGPSGQVVVADTFGWQVRIFDADLHPVSTFGQPPTGEGEPGPYDLFGPRDAVVTDAEIWVTDTGHDRIQVYRLDGAFVRSIGTEGAGEGQFDEPVSLALDASGDVLVADMFNSRVVRLGPDGSYKSGFSVGGWGGQDATDKPYITALDDGRIAVSLPAGGEVRIYSAEGELLSTIDGGDEPLQSPYGIVQATGDSIWVVEGGSSRVRLFDLP